MLEDFSLKEALTIMVVLIITASICLSILCLAHVMLVHFIPACL